MVLWPPLTVSRRAGITALCTYPTWGGSSTRRPKSVYRAMVEGFTRRMAYVTEPPVATALLGLSLVCMLMARPRQTA